MKIEVLRRMFKNKKFTGAKMVHLPNNGFKWAGRCWSLNVGDTILCLVWEDELDVHSSKFE